MATLTIEVPAAHDRTAIARLRAGLRTIATERAVASASATGAARLGNASGDPLRLGGHPPLGRYRYAVHEATQAEERSEYGAHVLLFEPRSGPALEAESFGRLGLLLYGGLPGRDGNMRRTLGGVRVSPPLLEALVARAAAGEDIELVLTVLEPRRWWQFWKSDVPTRPLSSTEPEMLEAPGDELSIVGRLLKAAPRRVRTTASGLADDIRDRDRSAISRSESFGETVQGKGGQYGGAGASGSWDDAAGARAGVDSAGRIIGTAAAVGALGAVAVAAMSREAAAANQLDAEGGLSDSAAQQTGAESPLNASGASDTNTAY